MWIYRNREGTILVLTELSIYEERQHTLKCRTELKRAPDQMDWRRPSGRKSKDNPKWKTEDFWEELTQQNSAGMSGQPEKGLRSEETI